MLFTVTLGHFSPKVLMISAVCGRAPPFECAPNAPPFPPADASISQDWLSVIKTRGFSVGELAGAAVCAWQSNPVDMHNKNVVSLDIAIPPSRVEPRNTIANTESAQNTDRKSTRLNSSHGY